MVCPSSCVVRCLSFVVRRLSSSFVACCLVCVVCVFVCLLSGVCYVVACLFVCCVCCVFVVCVCVVCLMSACCMYAVCVFFLFFFLFSAVCSLFV